MYVVSAAAGVEGAERSQWLYGVIARRLDLLPKKPSTNGVMIRIQYPPGILLG